MSDLDNPETYRRWDPSDLRGRIISVPQLYLTAWEQGSAVELPEAFSDARSVVVVGMGGSAMGGELLAGLAELEAAVPVHVVRDYTLPAWIGPETLVIASSYSGDTEETLSAYHQARERGALLLAMTSGGTLAREAAAHGIPLLRIDYEGEPRSAVGYSFGMLLALLCKIGLLENKEAELQTTVQLLYQMVSALGPEASKAQNLAKTVATAMHGRLPVVYGAEFLSGAAHRWKTQLNENSKVWAFYESMPELNHNAVVGYSLPAEVMERAYVVLLHSHLLHRRTSLRYQVTEELLLREGVAHRQLDGVGDTPLAHLLTTVLLGDFVSYYLGILNQVDPVPVSPIDYLKGRLAEG
ncbi:MAG: bifunctional phosphoglucose/phosphomannose isomerase [Chloroflexi bacterium]|nr:bifunctional phosphoglucose/phosphomannose isomerase [Chloroflexota bacterium]